MKFLYFKYTLLALIVFSFTVVLWFKFKQEKNPNIIIYVIDTLRGDRLSVTGYSENTSPEIDKFAKDATLFTNTFSTSCWTVPAHGSLFTGLFPGQHGATQENIRLQDDLLTLAEVLKANGYQTAAFTNNGLISNNNNFLQGFDYTFEEFRGTDFFPEDDFKDKNLHKTFKDVLLWLKSERKSNKPFFIFINTVEPHLPYMPPEPFRSKFLTKQEARLGWGNTLNDFIKDFFEIKVFNEAYRKVLPKLYNGEISYIDNQFGKFLTRLKQEIIINDTLFILTSDHGESLFQHGFNGHDLHLHEEVIKIPLIIRYPVFFKENYRDDRLVSLIDILPTILGILNIPVPEGLNGKNLLIEKEGHPFIMAEYFEPKFAKKFLKERFPEHPLPEKYDRPLTAIRSKSYKLIKSAKGEQEFYDLQKDPEELNNLFYSPEAQKAKEDLEGAYRYMKKLVKAEQNKKQEETVFDEETRKNLKTLGYIN